MDGCPLCVTAAAAPAPPDLTADPGAPVPGVPLYPPAAWFGRPDGLEPGSTATVITDGDEVGRFWAYVAPWGQCLIDGTAECWTAPPSPTGYAAALQGDTLTAEGITVATGNIGGGVDHYRGTNFVRAVEHYANTASQLARVAYGEDDYGIWAAGCLWPGVTWEQVARIRGASLSGDWRRRAELRGEWDFAGAQLVSVPGFPLVEWPGGTFPAYHAVGSASMRTAAAVVGGFGGAYATPQPLEEVPMLVRCPTHGLTNVTDGTPPAAAHLACACQTPGPAAQAAQQAAAPAPQTAAPPPGPDGAMPDPQAQLDALAAAITDLSVRVTALEENAVASQGAELDAVGASLSSLRDLVTA